MRVEMSITYDTERWSSPWKAKDLESAAKVSSSPRVVSLSELPFFKSRQDIDGEAFFRLFTDDDEAEPRKSSLGEKRDLDISPD